MLAIKLWTALLILMASCIFAKGCVITISVEPQIIKEMISTQGSFCEISVKVLRKDNVTDYCDFWALIYEVEGLLEKLKFLPDSNYSRMKTNLINTYIVCIKEEGFNLQDAVDDYLQSEEMNPIQILERVNKSLHRLDGFKAETGSSSECEYYYKQNVKKKNDATEEQSGKRKEDPNPSNLPLIIIVTLLGLVLLLLCGLLYYRHEYRVLQRRLNRSCHLDLTRNPGAVLPEESEPLPTTECDLV